MVTHSHKLFYRRFTCAGPFLSASRHPELVPSPLRDRELRRGDSPGHPRQPLGTVWKRLYCVESLNSSTKERGLAVRRTLFTSKPYPTRGPSLRQSLQSMFPRRWHSVVSPTRRFLSVHFYLEVEEWGTWLLQKVFWCVLDLSEPESVEERGRKWKIFSFLFFHLVDWSNQLEWSDIIAGFLSITVFVRVRATEQRWKVFVCFFNNNR